MRLELTLPALERLLGGDKELEVHLRQQVCEEFARKHLKTILNDATWKAAYAEWTADQDAVVAAKLAELIGERRERIGNMKAGGEDVWGLRAKIAAAVEEEVSATIKRRITDYQSAIARTITGEVERVMRQNVKALVDAEVKKQLAAAAAFLEKGGA